jgi:hypothetical protein
MYKCCRCKETLSRDQFGGIKKRNDYCRPCKYAIDREYKKNNIEKTRKNNSAAQQRRYIKNRELLCQYLTENPCITCGESDIVVLDFDHRDPSTKRTTISKAATSWSWETIKTEIDKCDVLCANCHRRKTAKELVWYKHARMD